MQEQYHTIFRESYEHVFLVNVVNSYENENQPIQDTTGFALGTAFAVSSHGHFLSALHVFENYYQDIINGNYRIFLQGLHGLGFKNEASFEVEILDAYPKYDIILLQGNRKKKGFIKLGIPNVRLGMFIGSFGYPLKYEEEHTKRIIKDKRFISAMISQSIVKDGWHIVEIDKHVTHGHSGGPIITLGNYAIAIVSQYLPGKHTITEVDNHDKIRRQYLAYIPSHFSRCSLISNIKDSLIAHGIKIKES